jgi:hypothetical protein
MDTATAVTPMFHSASTARMLGDSRYSYVMFAQLSPANQAAARASYPYKAGGAYAFADEHYFYPVRKNGKLGRARRVLAIPRAVVDDKAAMMALGYPEPVVGRPLLQLVRVEA